MMTNEVLFSQFLEKVTANPKIELEWVDLLSQLEYVGCRKILKNVAFDRVSTTTLKHLSEEASHSYLLKKMAEESGLPVRPWTEGLFAKAGFEFFQAVDQDVSEIQHRDEDCYPAVSWVVETRVLAIYPTYLEKCSFPKVKHALSHILAQEEKPATQYGKDAFPENLKGPMLRIEEVLWGRFIESASAIIKDL